MKYLVVLCHPSTESISQIISNELTKLYNKYKIEVEVRDLYQIGFNPIYNNEDLEAAASGKVSEDVLKEQEYITNAEIIIFIYPVWWAGMPAMLKGYLERVFSEGFAYSYTNEGIKKLLEGKKIVLVNTNKDAISSFGKEEFNNANSFCQKCIFESYGMEVILHYYLENIYENIDRYTLNLKINNLRKEIKKSLIIENNSRLYIPTTFF